MQDQPIGSTGTNRDDDATTVRRRLDADGVWRRCLWRHAPDDGQHDGQRQHGVWWRCLCGQHDGYAPILPLHPFAGNYPPMDSTGYAVSVSDGYGSVEPDTDSDQSEPSTCGSLSETEPLHLQMKLNIAQEQLRVAKKTAKDAEKDKLTKASEAAGRATATEKQAREEAVAKHAELVCKYARAWDKAVAREAKEEARQAKKDEGETKPAVVLQPRGPNARCTADPVVLKQVNCRMRRVSIVTINYNGLGFSW